MVKHARVLVLLLATFVLIVGVSCGGGGGTTSSAAGPTPQSEPTSGARAARGPTASLDPRNGPPGTQVTVSGSGWAPGTPVTVSAASGSSNAKPYASVTTTDDGSFTTRFRLEKAPDGSDLKIGRFDLIARTSGTEVTLPFQVDVARPVRNPGDGGG